ncbi:hypothetical protein HY792_00875 [Candidatus Desantisbacteria bacterium]|nr:hypothetical protein [Candidatus Desantisbacteria bacterium]
MQSVSPLVHAVRQAAIEACINLGKKIFPTLLQACKPEPWEFYVNIMLACVSIAPEDERVQNLIQKAAYHSNPMARKYVISIIANHDFIWGEKVLKYLANDPKQEVSALAVKIISSLNMLSLKRITMSKGITEDELIKIEGIIDKGYNSDTLKKIYQQYLRHLFKENPLPQKKADIACAMSIVFADKDLFQRLLPFLPEGVKNVLNILVWEGGKHFIKKLEKMFGIQIAEKDGHSLNIRNAYLLFQVQTDYYNRKDSSLYLSDEFRKAIKRYLPLPEGYDLIPLDTIEKTDFIHADNAMILRQLALFVAYIKQGNIKFNKNQTKIMKGSVKAMEKCCHIREFYENKDLECIKTQLIVDFLIISPIEEINNPVNSLKQLFDNFFKHKGLKKYQLYSLLSYIKGDAFQYYGYHEEYEEKVKMSFFNLLKKMSNQHWYSMENVIKHCCYNDIYLDIVDRSIASRYLYYSKTDRYGYIKVNISETLYKDAIIIPLIKSAMFLFSAFGLLDIAYNLPENSSLQEKEHKYLSVFDGLQHIRLTKLGAYVLGLTKEYEMEKIAEQKANLILDEGRLLIHMEGEDALKRLALEKVGERIGNTHYRVDCNSFLKECFCEKDIQQKVMLFKDYISSNPPQIWQDFLNGILKRINPLTIEENTVVCKLTPEKELISLIATDEILKKYILKAENYRILIETTHINKIKKRLGELGYFVGNM